MDFSSDDLENPKNKAALALRIDDSTIEKMNTCFKNLHCIKKMVTDLPDKELDQIPNPPKVVSSDVQPKKLILPKVQNQLIKYTPLRSFAKHSTFRHNHPYFTSGGSGKSAKIVQSVGKKSSVPEKSVSVVPKDESQVTEKHYRRKVTEKPVYDVEPAGTLIFTLDDLMAIDDE